MAKEQVRVSGWKFSERKQKGWEILIKFCLKAGQGDQISHGDEEFDQISRMIRY